MKKVILLAMLMPLTAFCQFVENFESGNLNNWVQSTDGRWKADTTAAISEAYSLHHIFDNPDAGNDRIALPLKNLHPSQGLTRWSFILRHGYDPSSSNNWAVFLMSDTGPATMPVEGSTNGFAIGVNITGTDDTLRLIKVKGTILTTVVNCRINWQTSVGISQPLKIIVERSPEGNWIVSVFSLNGNSLGISYGADNELFSPAWFVILYRYSSTRDRLLWIDDIKIEGAFYEDNEAPVITVCKASGRNSVEITLNETPADEFIVPENFSLNSEGYKSVYVKKKTALIYIIEFANTLNNKSINNLIIRKLCDNSGNCTLNIHVPFSTLWAETGVVIISEVLADPIP